MKRIVIISDGHSGHKAGLTPPRYDHTHTPATHIDAKLWKIRREIWAWFAEQAKALQPVHLLHYNGDAIDGDGHKSEGIELLVPDRQVQALMASECIKKFRPKHVSMVYGTGYHTGNGSDIEDITANKVGADIGAHHWPEIDGTILDLKHHIGGTALPERPPMLDRARVHNLIWAEHHEQPRAHIIVRSHLHKWGGIIGDGWTGICTDALQGMGSRFGARRCEKHVSVGILVIDCYPNGRHIWQRHKAVIAAQRAKTTKY